MGKVILLLTALLVAGGSFSVLGQQSVALALPPQISGQSGVIPCELVRFVVSLARAGASSIDVYAPEEDQDELQELVNLFVTRLELETVVTVRVELADTDYDKVIWLGGYTWYGLICGDLPAQAADALLSRGRALAAKGDLLVGVGSGVIPLILTGVFPSGSEVAVYPCRDLIELCQERGLVPVLPSGEKCRTAGGEEVPPAGLRLAQAGEKAVLSVGIPNSWYGAEGCSELGTDYKDAYAAAVEYLEQAWRGELAAGWSAEVAPNCPEWGPRPEPERALVIIFPSFHDPELQGVTEFLEGKGVPWTIAAWQEARGATLSQCSPPAFRGMQGTQVQSDLWAWCAQADDYDLLYIIGSSRITSLFPCRGGTPSQAKERLFALISAFVEGKKPVFAAGSAPVVLGEADLVRRVVTCICDTTRMGDLMGCLTDHGALVVNPPGSMGVPFPAQVWDDGAFDEGIGTLYCHEQGRWSESELSAYKTALGVLYEVALDWLQAGTPENWRTHWPNR